MTEPELEPTNLSETVVRGAGLAGAGYVVGQVITLSFYLALSRLATPSDFGEFSAGALIVTTGLIFSESGMLAALIQRPDPIDAAASTAVVSTCLSGVLLSLGALALAPVMGVFFHSSTVGNIAAAMAGLLFLRSTMVVPEALLQRQFSFLRRVIIEPIGAIALGVAAVIACANGLGPWGLVIGYYAAAVVDVLLSWLLVRWRPQRRLISFRVWRELVSFGRHIVAVNMVSRGAEQVPTLLLGRFVGTNALGQYRYGDRMAATPIALIVQAGSYVLFPAFARITGDRDRFRAAAMRSLRLMCALAFPLGLLLVPLGVPSSVLLFGPPWREAGYAAMTMALLPAAGTPISFASEALKADGKPGTLTRIHIVLAVASIAAMFALLPVGLLGITSALSVGMCVAAVYALHLTGKLIGFSLREAAATTIAPAAASFLMIAILTPLEFFVVRATDRGTLVGIILLGAEALLGLLVYFITLRVIAKPLADEIRELMGQMARRFRRS